MGRRYSHVVANAAYAHALTAGQPYKIELNNLPTLGPRGGINVVERFRIKSPTIAQTIPAGKSLDAFSLGQAFKVQLALSQESPYAKGEGGVYLIPEGVWFYDLMRIWALCVGARVLRASNGRLRAPQIASADVTTPLSPYVAVKEQDDRPAFPQHIGPVGDDGGGGGAAFSSRVQYVIELTRRGERIKRGIPAAHFSGNFIGCSGKSAGYLTMQPSSTLKIDGTAFTLDTLGFELIADLYELNPDEVPAPLVPRLFLDTPNDKNFSLAGTQVPVDVIMEAPEDTAGAQTVSVLTTCFIDHGGIRIGDEAGDMVRHADYIADNISQHLSNEAWAYPSSTAALTSTVNANRFLRDVNIVFCAAGMSLLEMLPPGAKTTFNITSGTIPSGGWRILKMGWDGGAGDAAAQSVAKLGGDPSSLTAQTRNGNKVDSASIAERLPKMAKRTAQSIAAAVAAP